MKIKQPMLDDSERWLIDLLKRFKKQSKPSTNDLEMCQYTLEIVQSRLRDVGGTPAPPELTPEMQDLFPIPGRNNHEKRTSIQRD